MSPSLPLGGANCTVTLTVAPGAIERPVEGQLTTEK